MNRSKPKQVPLHEHLGMLAMEFRGTRDETERARIVKEYADVVTRLIESGKWGEIPPLEDQLPDDRMPRAFFKHWSLPLPNGRHRRK